MQKLTIDLVNAKLEKLFFVLVEPYKGALAKHRVSCLNCKNQIETRIDRILNHTTRCNFCILKEKEKGVKLQLIERHIDLLTPFSGVAQKHDFSCMKCAHVWTTTICSITSMQSGCPKCVGVARRTCDDVRSLLQEKGIDIMGPYETRHTKIKLHCRVCSHGWETSDKAILYGYGCFRCGRRKTGLRRRLTPIEVAKRLQKRSVELLDTYEVGKNTNTFRCLKCEHKWQDISHRVLWVKNPCPSCSSPLPLELSVIEAQLKARNICIVGEFKNDPVARTQFKCLVCAHHWTTFNRGVLQIGNGCQKCHAASLRLSQDEVVQRLKTLNIDLIGAFTGVMKPVTVCCATCKYEWQLHLHKLRYEGKCRKCLPHRFGTSENQIRCIFESITGWKFPKRRPAWLRGRSSVPMELDGYNEQHSVAFEYQVEQHYKPIFGDESFKVTKRNDERKRVLCYNRGVVLIRIPYWKTDVESFIRENLKKAGFAF